MNKDAGQGENELRIKAAVRAVLSPGVWFVIAVRVLIVVLWSNLVMPAAMSPNGDAGSMPSMAVLVALFLFAYAYLFGGALRSFVVGDGTVSVPEALRRGKEVFNQFVWLCVKAVLVVLLVIVVFLSVFAGGAGGEVEVQSRLEEIAPTMNLISSAALFVIPFALVYWLPLVFVTQDFRMLPTMKVAVTTLWGRLRKSSYLAILVLLPVVIFWLLPHEAPLLAVLVLGVIGDLMRWTARVYCVQVLVQDRGIVARTTSR